MYNSDMSRRPPRQIAAQRVSRVVADTLLDPTLGGASPAETRRVAAEPLAALQVEAQH